MFLIGCRTKDEYFQCVYGEDESLYENVQWPNTLCVEVHPFLLTYCTYHTIHIWYINIRRRHNMYRNNTHVYSSVSGCGVAISALYVGLNGPDIDGHTSTWCRIWNEHWSLSLSPWSMYAKVFAICKINNKCYIDFQWIVMCVIWISLINEVYIGLSC